MPPPRRRFTSPPATVTPRAESLRDAETEERERRTEVYALLAERDRRRSVFDWPDSPSKREWTGTGRLTLWRPEMAMR